MIGLRSVFQSKKVLYSTLISVVIAALAVGVFVLDKNNNNNEKEEEHVEKIRRERVEIIAESGNAMLAADEGVNVDFLVSEEDGERAVFERYRLLDAEAGLDADGFGETINISEEYADVFLTHPDGTREEVTSGSAVYLMRILPPMSNGTYKLTAEMKTGETYEFEFEFPISQKVRLVRQNLTRTQQKPEKNLSDEDLTVEERQLLRDLDFNDRESRDLQAFSLEGVDLSKASSVFQVQPSNAPVGGYTPAINVDEYFWLDLELMEEEYFQWEQLKTYLDQQEELGPAELPYVKFLNRPTRNEYIFMAKVDGVWYYAMADYPNDFK